MLSAPHDIGWALVNLVPTGPYHDKISPSKLLAFVDSYPDYAELDEQYFKFGGRPKTRIGRRVGSRSGQH